PAPAAEEVFDPVAEAVPPKVLEALEPFGKKKELAENMLLVTPGITVGDFARMIDKRTGDIVKELMGMGEMIPGGGAIPEHALEKLGTAFGYEVLVEETDEEEEPVGPTSHKIEYTDDPASMKLRPAVVTVMGHVDHGKTQLLDTIRQANVIAGEAGGITQHIGAYQVAVGDTTVTFLDTPGHEAFTALRSRGTNVTDIAVIVVAADDSVMPQTAEAISHAQAADVPIIIAINKMDLPAADPFAVRAALTQHNVVVEDLGGDVVAVEMSALKGDGVETLLEMIGLIAEVEEFKANPAAAAIGTVIEAQLEVGRGPVATVIVQRGTLKRGDAIVAGESSGRVRAMFNDKGEQVQSAGPSTPVLVTGWDDVPVAGDMFQVPKNERTARKLADARTADVRASELRVPTATERLGQLLEHLRTSDHAELRVIVKADAHGSLEAIRDSLAKITREDARITIIHGAVGGITANDVMLAEASDAVIYGFNARPDTNARRAAKDSGIDIRTFSIIYELLDDAEKLLLGQLSADQVESFLGVAEVRAVFRAPRLGMVAGSYVTEGEISRNARARLVREGVVIYDGKIATLRRFKDDVQTVATGFECGIGLEKFRDIKEGDTIESYEVNEVART
ncbi:Translation initiation factor 2, partial [hydrothermal vent metagenome]